MRRLFVLMIGVLAVAWLASPPAKASTLTDCLAKNHVCVSSAGRSLISDTQQAQLERDIGGDDIYLVVAASGPSGYNAAMVRSSACWAPSTSSSSPASWIPG